VRTVFCHHAIQLLLAIILATDDYGRPSHLTCPPALWHSTTQSLSSSIPPCTPYGEKDWDRHANKERCYCFSAHSIRSPALLNKSSLFM
jgi:hypothetical protein